MTKISPNAVNTPAAQWREDGQPDPHGDRYDCPRSSLPMGNLTDDEMANAVFMANRNDLRLVVFQDAAKERIRWLSRQLSKCQAAPAPAVGVDAEVLALRAERDSFRAVVEGACYGDIDGIAKNTVEQSRALGEAVMHLTMRQGKRAEAAEAARAEGVAEGMRAALAILNDEVVKSLNRSDDLASYCKVAGRAAAAILAASGGEV